MSSALAPLSSSFIRGKQFSWAESRWACPLLVLGQICTWFWSFPVRKNAGRVPQWQSLNKKVHGGPVKSWQCHMWRDAEASLKSGGCFSSLSLISCLVCETDSALGQGLRAVVGHRVCSLCPRPGGVAATTESVPQIQPVHHKGCIIFLSCCAKQELSSHFNFNKQLEASVVLTPEFAARGRTLP